MILLIDTSGRDIKLGLDDKIKIIQTEKQSLDLPGAVQSFVAESGAVFADLTAIGVIVGPGSFTGIRLGIAYAKGLSIGLGIPVVSVNAFEVYMEKSPNAFVAIDSGRGDFFVAAHDLPPVIMTIDDVETHQMNYPKTVGHLPYDLTDALPIVTRKLSAPLEPVIPLYMRASYAEENHNK